MSGGDAAARKDTTKVLCEIRKCGGRICWCGVLLLNHALSVGSKGRLGLGVNTLKERLSSDESRRTGLRE